MTPTKTTATIKLTDTLTAEMEVKREGQDSPSQSDEVSVVLVVTLPDDDRYKHSVHRDLAFGERCRFFGYYLMCGPNTSGRLFTEHFKAPTWREAFALAEARAHEQLGLLLTACSARKQALIDAEG